LNLYLRLFLTILRALRAPRLVLGDTVELTLRVLPTDLDLNGHMNNGRYLTLATGFVKGGTASHGGLISNTAIYRSVTSRHRLHFPMTSPLGSPRIACSRFA
jgi:hypothetical protein